MFTKGSQNFFQEVIDKPVSIVYNEYNETRKEAPSMANKLRENGFTPLVLATALLMVLVPVLF